MRTRRNLAARIRPEEQKATQTARYFSALSCTGLAFKKPNCAAMTDAPANFTTLPVPGKRSIAYVVQWLRELEECRVGGLVTAQEYAVERAEKLAEILCKHRRLWLAPLGAAWSIGAIVASVVWMATMDWQMTGLAAALGGLFGLVVLARPCRDRLKHIQICDRLEILTALLSYDLVSADEFIVYEERLHGGEGQLKALV